MEKTTDIKKVKELASKLKEMAERGTEHERLVAENKLKSLLNKYGITLLDITKNEKKLRTFSFKNEDETMIMAHVIWSIVPNININRKGKQKKAFCELTPNEYIEIKEKIKFYLADFDNQKKSFILGYILKNNLEVESSDNHRREEDSDNEIDIKKLANMMHGIDEVNYKSKKEKKLI